MARERAPLKPGWVNTDLPESFFTDVDFLKIYAFFVCYAFHPNRSSKGKTMADFHWPKNVWSNSSQVGLKDVLLYTADLHQRTQTVDSVSRAPMGEETFVSCQKLDDMSSTCQKAGVQHDFTRTREKNRIAVYNSEGNIFLSVFDHIRNALAHGRFTIYNDGMIAMESGKNVYDCEKRKNMMDVRARMLLKKETLLNWIAIIEAGELDVGIVKEIENTRTEEKTKRKRKKKMGNC